MKLFQSFAVLLLAGSSYALEAVSQIGDGQIQATTATPAASTVEAVSQIGDGQIQATTGSQTGTLAISTVVPVSQISDGQIQASTGSANTLRTVSTLLGSGYSSLASSKSLSGGLSGSLITLTTSNANGVEVTIVATAVVTGSDGSVSIATGRGSGSSEVSSNGIVTQISNSANNLQGTFSNTLIFGAAFAICVVLNAILL